MADEQTGFGRQVDDVAGRFKLARPIIGALLLFLAGFAGWEAVQQAASPPVQAPASTAPVGS